MRLLFTVCLIAVLVTGCDSKAPSLSSTSVSPAVTVGLDHNCPISLKKLKRASRKRFPLRDADCYAMIRERETLPLFPEMIPVGTLRADFRYTPRSRKRSGILALRLELTRDELTRHEMLVRRAAVASLPKDKPGPFFDHVLSRGVTTWPPSKRARPGAEARVYLLGRSGHDRGHMLDDGSWAFDRGSASGVTVDEAFRSVLYWSTDW